MKKTLPLLILGLLVLSTSLAVAGTRRININIPFNTDVSVVKSKLVNIRADCIKNQSGNDILRVYTKTSSDKVVQDGLDAFDGQTYLTASTLEENARLMEISSPTNQFLAKTPESIGGFVADTNEHGGKITYSPDSAIMAVAAPGSKPGCFLSLSVEVVSGFKTVTK